VTFFAIDREQAGFAARFLCIVALQAQFPPPSKCPLDPAVVTLEPSDLLTDALVEDRVPRNELKLEPVLDHRKPAADKVGDSSETAADVVATSPREVDQAAFSRHLLADPFDF
jgi:hypothetical protein